MAAGGRRGKIPAPPRRRGLPPGLLGCPMRDASPDLSVVVPVYNEEGNVRPLAEEIVAALAGRATFEILFVDDGSTDGTAAALARLSDDLACVRAVAHRANCGQSAAIWTGVSRARGAWVATLDGDGQNDPADLPALLQRARDPAAPGALVMVAGVRTRRQDNWLRRVSSRLANGVRAAVLGDGTPDTGCGLKLFRRDAFLALPLFDHMHRFLPALMRRGGGVVLHVEVGHRPRLSGRSKYGLGINNRLWAGVVDLLGVLWLQRRAVRPAVMEPDAATAAPPAAEAGPATRPRLRG